MTIECEWHDLTLLRVHAIWRTSAYNCTPNTPRQQARCATLKTARGDIACNRLRASRCWPCCYWYRAALSCGAAASVPKPTNSRRLSLPPPECPPPAMSCPCRSTASMSSRSRRDRCRSTCRRRSVIRFRASRRRCGRTSQDLQLSIRGFGARSQFGVRGVRLYSDGIPGTMPDGQGQFSQFDLGCRAQHIEVMRGPELLGTLWTLLGQA